MSLLMDLALVRRLERAEAQVGVTCVEVRQRIDPEVGAAWHEYTGTFAFFDGAQSPLTQSFGLGLHAPVTAESLAEIEAFFDERRAMPQHEVNLLAGVETHAVLIDRGYRLIETSNVLVQPVADAPQPSVPGLHVRLAGPEDEAAWVDTAVAGWSESPELAPLMRSIARVSMLNPLMTSFLVERDGAPIASASLAIHDGVALLAGASTIPAGRGLGAQSALLGARLAEARRRGCDVAMIVATPASSSQRNAERRGFRIASSRTKWQRATRS